MLAPILLLCLCHLPGANVWQHAEFGEMANVYSRALSDKAPARYVFERTRVSHLKVDAGQARDAIAQRWAAACRVLGQPGSL
jgi:hypothetical protein